MCMYILFAGLPNLFSTPKRAVNRTLRDTPSSTGRTVLTDGVEHTIDVDMMWNVMEYLPVQHCQQKFDLVIVEVCCHYH